MTYFALDPVAGIERALVTIPWKASDKMGDWDVSLDGREIAMTSPAEADFLLTLIDLLSGRSSLVPLGVHSPIRSVNWSADGKGWFVALNNNLGSDLLFAARNRAPVLLRQTTRATYASPSPDGRRIAFVDQNIDGNLWLLRP